MSKEGKIVFCTGGGCTAKLGAGALSRILEKLPAETRRQLDAGLAELMRVLEDAKKD